MIQTLPNNFLWGSSTSSMQTEGGWNEGGKGKSVYDVRTATQNSSDWHVAIDEYHRYDEDLDLMKRQGMNCYRFQISWSRVCPTGNGPFNEEGIKFYDDLIDKLLFRNIIPMICLYHFDMPLVLAKEYNGFIDRHVMNAFVRYGKKMIDCFADRVPYWITFNEQNLYLTPDSFQISGYLKGNKSDNDLYQISHHVMVAHAEIANYIHLNTKAKVGGMLAYQEIYPASSNPRDIELSRRADEFLNQNLLNAFAHGQYSSEVLTFLKNNQINLDSTKNDQEVLKQLKSDYIAFSYYRSIQINSDKVPIGTIPNRYLNVGSENVPGLRMTEWKWNVDPIGFRDALTQVYNRYHLPLFPIENGIGVREMFNGFMIQDDYRIDYHREHIRELKRAVLDDGVNVLGYLVWGLVDMLSSSGNMEKRYGMVYVNRANHDLKNLKRIPKKSYEWFKQVIATNGNDIN